MDGDKIGFYYLLSNELLSNVIRLSTRISNFAFLRVTYQEFKKNYISQNDSFEDSF